MCEHPTDSSDDDVAWMSQLPYTITIPGSFLADDVDTIVVHAGLIPNELLESQEADTMMTLRDVVPISSSSSSSAAAAAAAGTSPLATTSDGDSRYVRFEGRRREQVEPPGGSDEVGPIAWASAWKGPQRVIFGHDARRGLQQCEGGWALGLDSGAVYGRGMTGVILPGRKIVSIETKCHQKVDND